MKRSGSGSSGRPSDGETNVETLACVLCNMALDKRIDKNGKPYFICDLCGTQFFVCRQEGISRLEALMRKPTHARRAKIPDSKKLIEQICSFRKDAVELDELLAEMPYEMLDWLDDFQKRLMQALDKMQRVLAPSPKNRVGEKAPCGEK